MLCLSLALAWASGCSFSGPKRASSTFDKAQSDLYSEDAATADHAALLLISMDVDSYYRVLRAALAPQNAATIRSAVLRAYIAEKHPGIEAEALGALGDENRLIVDLAKSYLTTVAGEGVVSELLATAKDQSRPAVARVAALEVLGKIGVPGPVDGIIDILSNSKGAVAEAAAGALYEITRQPFEMDAEAWRIWYKGYGKYTQEQWKRLAASYYKQVGELQAEIEKLHTKAGQSEADAVKLYGNYVDLAAQFQRYDLIIAVLAQAPYVEAQAYAAQVLGKEKVPKAVPVLVEKSRDTDSRLAKACISALGAIGDPAAAPDIAPRLFDPDVAIKIAVIRALSTLPGSDISDFLILLNDPVALVRAEAARAIGGCKWKPGVGPLLELLQRKPPEAPEVRTAAAEALGEIGDKSAVPVLVTLMKDSDDKVRFTAARSLTVLAEASCYDALLDATHDRVAAVREAAVVGLAAIGDKRAVDRMLEMVLTDPERTAADQSWTSLRLLVGKDRALALSISLTLLDAGKAMFPKAEALLKDVADSPENTPEVTKARRALAKAYLDAGNDQAAQAYFQRILDQSADDAEALSGIVIALRNQGDMPGLAVIYARQIASGGATADTSSYFLGILNTLLTAGAHRAVAECCQQVLSSSQSGDESFRTSVKELQAVALPHYFKVLVADLGGNEVAARTARDSLAIYGRAAVSALVEGLDDASEAARTACLELLRPLADGQTYGFDPGKPPAGQQDSIAQWRAWAAVAQPEK